MDTSHLVLASILAFLITIGYTQSILSNFLGRKITDMVNTISVNHLVSTFVEKLFSIGLVK